MKTPSQVKDGMNTLPPASIEAVVQKADIVPTQADNSDAAAKGSLEFDSRYISYETPGSDRREDEIPSMQSIDGMTFLDPPENPSLMYQMMHLSAYLEPVMSALQTNVYKAPYELKPTIPFDRPIEAQRIVHDAMLWDKAKVPAGKPNFDLAVTVTEAEVEAQLEKLKTRSVLEKQYLSRFFEEAVPDMTYRQLGALTGQDYEITGNAYWEISRDTAGNIARFQWMPSLSVRCTPQSATQTVASKLVRDSVLGWKTTPQYRRFRQYGQIRYGRGEPGVVAWFKEFGDPRVMSRATGKYYESIEELQTAEANRDGQQQQIYPATEVLHFKLLYGGSSVYGKPRWSGNYISLLGTRELEEENQKIVGDEAVPSLLFMISGGTVGTKSFKGLESQIAERKKGRKGIMLIEATAQGKGPATPTQQPTIQMEKLRSEQNTDMLFQKYDERSEEKIDAAWRLPSIALGKAKTANKAIADVMQRYTEDQVYSPLRQDKDEIVNNRILADLGITMWKYCTKSVEPHDPRQRAEILGILVEAGILTPNEARELATDIFSNSLEDLQGLWTLFPPRVLTVLLQTKNVQLAAGMLGEDKEALMELSNRIRDSLGLNPDGSSTLSVADAQKTRQGGTSADQKNAPSGKPKEEKNKPA